MPVPHRQFNQEIAPRVPFEKATKRTPDKARNVTLPYVEALLMAGTMFLLSGGVCIAVGWGVEVALWFGSISGTIMLIVGVIRAYMQQIIYTIETVTGLDVNRDGAIGEPPEPEEIIVNLVVGNSTRRIPFPVPNRQAMYELCAGLINQQRPFSEGEWTGRGQPFSRAQFRVLRATLLERGIMRWRDERYPTQGVELTDEGDELLRSILEGRYGRERREVPRLAQGQRGNAGLLEEDDE